MIADAYSYSKNIDFTIEHAPTGNLALTDYTSVTFFYSLDPPPLDFTLPDIDARRVSDPDRIIFIPGWTVPIRSFSFRNATVAKKIAEIGKEKFRHLAFWASGRDIFGPHHISFICSLPKKGQYKAGIKALNGPDQGIVQVLQFDRPVGNPLNLYAENRQSSPILNLGVFDMNEGDNVFMLAIVGKDPRSAGLGLDIVQLVFEWVR